MAKKLFYIFLSLFLLSPSVYAQKDPDDDEVFIDDLGRLPESFEMTLDSLLNKRYREYYTLAKTEKPTNDTRTLDQLYRKRLDAMESAIPLTYNPAVRQAIDLYVNKKSSLLSNMLAKATYYFPIIEAALDRNGLPLELKYLAIVESALNPTAVSRAGATGLWQFMLPTGKAYGLHIDSMVDERCDPHKSSQAMADYFKDMYALYGDWMLAIAAYNCGPGNINKAIRRSGGKTDFWQIYQYLPRETRSYVPFFIAAFYAMEHYEEHDIRPRMITMPLATDTVLIDTKLSFSTISEMTGVDISVIRELNPEYRREIIPGNNRPQILRLPATDACQFSAVKDSLLLVYKTKEIEDKATYIHVVQNGETLESIAKKYGVTVDDIKGWNSLTTVSLRRGQNLRVILPEGYVEQKEVTKAKQEHTRYYTVKRGDTLSGIAKKHKGATVSKIRAANGIRGNMIRPGQRLKIPY